MNLTDFRPRPTLVVPQSVVLKPRFPIIDAHNHLAEPFGGGWDKKPINQLLNILDEAEVQLYIDLDGGWGESILHQHLDYFKNAAPERFRIFGGVDWSQWPIHGNKFGEWAAAELRKQAQRGAEGLKIWKPLGLHVRDQNNTLVAVDDPRLGPIWATAGDLGLPVLIHVADPVAFFDPIDEYNERWEELGQHPDWAFTSPPFPPFLSIANALARVVERHPGTTFIGAHVGCYAENLGWVSSLLNHCPNFYVDISARLGELGRQPYTARRFLIEHADRILFGIDAGPDLATYRLYFRLLETEDEYFNYSVGEIPPQGRWQVYGLHLPDEILQKVYFNNARRIFNVPSEPPAYD